LEWCVIKIDALFSLFSARCARERNWDQRVWSSFFCFCFLFVFFFFLVGLALFVLFSVLCMRCIDLAVCVCVCVYFFLFFFLLVSLRGWQRTGCGRQRKDSAREQGRVASVNTFSAREREREREGGQGIWRVCFVLCSFSLLLFPS